MIRKIRKIMSLVLVAMSVSALAPRNVVSLDAIAAVNDNLNNGGSKITMGTQMNSVTLAGTDISSMVPDGSTLITMAESATINPQLEDGIKSMFNYQGASSISSEECGNLSYTLSDTLVEQISEEVLDALVEPVTNAVVLKAKSATGGAIPEATLKSLIEPVVRKNLEDELPNSIKGRFENITLYQYTGKNSSGDIKAQAFVIKGLVGSIVNTAVGSGAYCVNTYNAKVRNATYNSLAPVPALAFNPTTGADTYGKEIDLSSGANVIGDGMSINIIDTSSNKVYVINNPIYNMLKAQKGASGYINKDLNIIDFNGISNLKGSLSNTLDVDGTKFSLLSLSLTKSNEADKNKKVYQYDLIVGPFEKQLLFEQISGLNLPSVTTDAVKSMIKNSTYLMVPDVKAEVGGIVDNVIDKSGVKGIVAGITDAIDNLSDSVDDLTDSLKKKNEDLDDAWDKVFDRFDNDPGWVKKDGYRYYYDKDGVSLKGVQKIKGKTYYFNRIDGAMETGWQIVDGKRCYFDKKKGYELFNQWVQDGEDWYFVGEDGSAKKMEWVNDGGKSYYLKADGKMTKDWLKIEDYWYYFSKSGAKVTSDWKWSDGKWYYLKNDGQAAQDWLEIGDKLYCFKDPSGEMQTGWFRKDGSWYCANDDGSMKTGWAYSKDGWCYLDEETGKMKKNEWVTVEGKTYYFNINGVMVTGSRYIDGTKYIFNSDGTLGS
ncbi:cell wall-binding protein [Clostridium chromiireducens]|uniref:Cell wall-binding protein n=1 Tax=Clostridium chromiireducens TaxID=225345 RepID=A0A964W270_9CLOT|nr:N-acetylmuramoyl-L-alanine amidase family protein [Clostridium chromiireducens]MVX63910.1 cell wall-binding protein [Clostridium chromiireducens]